MIVGEGGGGAKGKEEKIHSNCGENEASSYFD